MVKKSNLSCPQCHHQNSLDAIKCSLCDWSLMQKQLDETQISEEAVFENDPNRTILPDFDSSNDLESDLTQAPKPQNTYSTSPNLSIAEKKTFHFAGDLAHFEIHEILGQGGMGAVYHAKDRTLHRDVAIKMLRPLVASSQINTEALLDEARMASKLNHPNIVTIYDVARTKDSNYIVMEWVDGQPLDEIIPNEGLELEKALEYACQIADGLTNAHQKYIIHKDIKPHNIMLSSENTIKILDFGIAGYINRQNDETDDSSEPAQTSSGTPSYMSPEQAQGLNLDQRSDIFSFGIVLYQMLCGKRPFLGNNRSELKQAICTGDCIPIQQHLPELPTNIVQLVDKMLATQKDQRWQSSTELAEALHAIYNELTYKKNWWQRRHWINKVAIILPFVLAIGWSSKEILFPASTQQLIERQLQEATKIAILPFDNISGDPLLQLFSDGLAVNLGSDLSAIASHQGNTWIVPSTEISRMKDQSPKKVADKYGVNLILTGSIQHMGSTRLLVLNLLNAKDGQQLKTAEVSIDAEQLFQGHKLIRKKALGLLGWSIPDDLITKFNAQRPQLDGAYKEYVQGMGYLYRFDQAGNFSNAQYAFKEAIQMDPSYQLAYIGLSESQLLSFRKTQNVKWLDKMEITIESLNDINPENFEVDYLKAELLTRKGLYQKAISLFENCIKKDSKHIKSYIGLANAYDKSGKIKKAEVTYQNAINISPNNGVSYIEFGIFYFRNGNYLKAIEQSKQLALIAPNNDYAYLHMAASYYSLDQIEKAIENTNYALEINPSDSGYSNLATMFFYKKEYINAIIAYEKAIKLNPTYYMIWGNLADAYKLTNNNKSVISYQNAANKAKKSLKTNPKDSTAKAALAYYLANLGRQKEAIVFAKQIGKLNTGYENFFVATAYDQLGMVNQTLTHLKLALDKNYSLKEIHSTPLLENFKKVKQFKQLLENN